VAKIKLIITSNGYVLCMFQHGLVWHEIHVFKTFGVSSTYRRPVWQHTSSFRSARSSCFPSQSCWYTVFHKKGILYL